MLDTAKLLKIFALNMVFPHIKFMSHIHSKIDIEVQWEKHFLAIFKMIGKPAGFNVQRERLSLSSLFLGLCKARHVDFME